MDLFNLAAKLTLDSGGFDKGVVGAEKSGKGLASSLEGTFSKIKKLAAGALSVAALKKGFDALMDLANATADYGDRVDKQSQALGLSRKAYQEWDYILGQNGASIDSLGVSMKTLNSLVLDAAAGGKESKDTFAQLGLGIHEIEQLEPEKQFEEVVRAFQRMPAGAKKSALAVKVFGRNGMELLPLLNQSATSIDELRARAEELGLIMSDDAVDAAVVYGDSLDDLKRTFDAFKYSIGAKILPILTSSIQKITAYAGKFRKAYDEKGLAGVWDTLVESFKSIKWPTKEEIIGKIKELWKGVQDAARNVLKLIFGESEDGDIKWPTPEEIETKVKEGLTTMWNGVKELAGGILKLIFGETEDGGIDWPTPGELWTKIQDGIKTLWTGIQALAGGVLKFVFGETEDGGIDWPTAAEVWAKIKEAFGVFWEGLKSLIEAQIKYVLDVPELPDAHTAGQILRGKLKEWWEAIKKAIKSVFEWFLPDPDMEDKDGTDMKEAIGKWWDEKVVPALKGVLDFVLGLFDLPPFDDMVQKVKDWWEDVKKNVGDLVLNVVPNFLFGGAGNSEEDWDGSLTAPGQQGFALPTHAKGLNYVPYDNYPALLHRGEQVLTASQARRNSGISGGSMSIDSAVIAAAVSDAIRTAMPGVSVNSYLSGKDITDSVDRDMARKLKARRFAT